MADRMKPQIYKDPRPAEYFNQFHESARKGVGWTYDLRPHRPHPADAAASTGSGRSGSRTCRARAPLVLAPNHFSQMDHFFVGVYLRRKIRFMAKSQLFGPPVLTYIFKHGGVFPVRRGHHDEEAFKTAYDAPRPGRDAARLRRGRPLALAASSASRNRASAGSRWSRARRSCRSRSTARPGARLEAAALPEGHGRSSASRSPSRSSRTPSRERQLEVATEIFARVREMYEGLATRSGQRAGRRSRDRAPA